MRRHAQAAFPAECCGLILGGGDVSVYEGKAWKPGGVERRLEAAHPSFGHVALADDFFADKEWGPEVPAPPA